MNVHLTNPDSGPLFLAGKLEIYDVQELQSQLLECLQNRPALRIDARGLETCDPAGLQLLWAARRSALALQKDFAVENLTAEVGQTALRLGLRLEDLASSAPSLNGAEPLVRPIEP
jgi:anti-anti-sigma regulatory factor